MVGLNMKLNLNSIIYILKIIDCHVYLQKKIY